jgi:magnesium chelatase accessory protein
VLSLPGMAIAVADLLRSLGRSPDVIAGHSAGAALALRMTLDALVAPKAVIGFNPALIPPPQIWVDVLAPLAGLLVESSWLARSAAWVAGRGGAVRALLESSGARLTDAQVARYAHLFSDPAHCAAALSMMNRWNLPALARDAAGLAVAFTAYAGERDVWVPQSELTSQVTRIPGATLVRVPGVGHLLPEESPETAVNAIRRSLS